MSSKKRKLAPIQQSRYNYYFMKTYRLKGSSKRRTKIDYRSRLNDEQYRVVSSSHGPSLIIAGPGSGKTRTLVYRVAWLIEQGVQPSSILLVTFTNKAAKEMLKRIEILLGAKPNIWGGTFHHIGNITLRRYARKLGYKPNFSILDEEEARDLMKLVVGEEAKELNSEQHFPKASVIRRLVSHAVNSELPIEDVIQERFPYFEAFVDVLKNIADHYESKKKTMNAMDYDDLLSQWRILLKNFPEVKKRLARSFQHILVDEYQDTNRLQAAIIRELGSEHQNVMVVGDDAQSIYSFRAAHVGNIFDFPKTYRKARTHALVTNYRSTTQILEFANAILENITNKFPKKLKSIKGSGAKPIVAPVQTLEQQASFVSQRIEELHRDEGVDLENIAVLYRANHHALELELELQKRGLPYQKRGGIRFFEQAHIKDALSFLRVLINPADELPFKRSLRLFRGIGVRYAATIWENLGQGQVIADVSKSRKKLLQINEALPSSLKSSYTSWLELVQELAKIYQDKGSAGELIQEVVDRFYKTYAQGSFENASERLEDLAQLATFAKNEARLDWFLSRVSLEEAFRGERFADQHSGFEDVLTISTIHQAKGLEWEVVFIISLIEGYFPHAKSLNNAEQYEEEQRLFYVAVTRAKSGLYLTYPLMTNIAIAQTSSFLSSLPEDLYERWEIKGENLLDGSARLDFDDFLNL